MLKTILLVLSALAFAGAQVPSWGYCPEYVPMSNFDMSKFLGVWYEAERYFQISEVASRCVMANYTKAPDGKLRVSNEVTNRFTGIKRILEGEIKPAASKSEEGKLRVKYTTFPLNPETNYAVLDTDYKNYAVLWSCSGVGLVNAQNAWLMTRARRPSGEALQMAYGVLDKYKISKTFFVKSDQEDCAYLDFAEIEKPSEEKPVILEELPIGETAESNNLRSAIPPEDPEDLPETRKVEAEKAPVDIPAKVEEPFEVIKPQNAQPSDIAPLAIEKLAKVDTVEKEPIAAEVKIDEEKPSPVVTVPEVILRAADTAKETAEIVEQIVVHEPAPEIQKPEPVQADVEQPSPVVPALPAEAPKEEEKKTEKIES